jgi:hypothetical protein
VNTDPWRAPPAKTKDCQTADWRPAWIAMKRPVILLVWLLAVAALPAEDAARTWTDTQGRTLSGVFVEASAQEVIVRRQDGSIAHLPRTSLSADDLAYADKAQASKPVSVTIDASRSKFTTKTTETPNLTTYVDGWGFNVNLTTLLQGHNLRADYQLYYRRTKKMGDELAAQPLAHQGGTATLDELKPKGTASFRTTTVAITIEQLRDGTWAVLRSGTYTDTKLEGIWVRLFENDQMIGEYASSEEFRKAGWPADTPATKGAPKKKAAAPPTP